MSGCFEGSIKNVGGNVNTLEQECFYTVKKCHGFWIIHVQIYKTCILNTLQRHLQKYWFLVTFKTV